TGQVLQDAMLEMVSQLGKNYAFGGVATPSTNPGTPTTNTFYIATEAGTYTNMGGVIVEQSEIAFFAWDGSAWSKEAIALDDQVGATLLGGKFSIPTEVGVDGYVLDTKANLLASAPHDILKPVFITKGSTVTYKTKVSYGYEVARLVNGAYVGVILSRNSYEENTFIAEETGDYVFVTEDCEQYPLSAFVGSVECKPFINELLTHIEYDIDKRSTLALIERDAMRAEYYTRTMFTEADYCGFCNLGTVSLAVNTFNGFLVPIYEGIEYKYTNAFISVKMLARYPQVGDPVYNVDWSKVNDYPYLLFTFDITTFAQYAKSLYIDRKVSNPYKSIFPLFGKKVVFFGDSMLEYGQPSNYNRTIPQQFENASGAVCVNGGIGGTQLGARGVVTASPTTIKEAYANVDVPNLVKAWATNSWASVDSAVAYIKANTSDDNSAQVSALKNNPISSADIVVVFAGTNDLNASTLGEHGGGGNRLLATGIDSIVESITTANPNIVIYFFNPIPRYCQSLTTGEQIWCDDYRDGFFVNLTKKVLEVANANHCAAFNTFGEIGINKFNIGIFAYGGTDTVHLTGSFDRIARYMYSSIKSKLL
ncbi:MAG: hypothetical protein II236_00800, partial [Alistipes sp.]|nr:hypothetical protein [Alistipes sp.]